MNSGRKAERLEMKKSTSRRGRNPCTWWRLRKWSHRRRNSIMSEWDAKSHKERKEREPRDGHRRKFSHQEWGFLLQPGTLIIASHPAIVNLQCPDVIWSDWTDGPVGQQNSMVWSYHGIPNFLGIHCHSSISHDLLGFFCFFVCF